jgi:hypothetical protein
LTLTPAKLAHLNPNLWVLPKFASTSLTVILGLSASFFSNKRWDKVNY